MSIYVDFPALSAALADTVIVEEQLYLPVKELAFLNPSCGFGDRNNGKAAIVKVGYCCKVKGINCIPVHSDSVMGFCPFVGDWVANAEEGYYLVRIYRASNIRVIYDTACLKRLTDEEVAIIRELGPKIRSGMEYVE